MFRVRIPTPRVCVIRCSASPGSLVFGCGRCTSGRTRSGAVGRRFTCPRAVVLPAAQAGLCYYMVNNEGSPFLVVPAFLALPFVLRALIRGWLGSARAVRQAP